MKKIVLFCVFFCSLGANAQNAANQRVYPPSPEANSLIKFVQTPVSLYSGVPDINVPVYTIKTKDITVPISLSYHAQGIKVDEEASWVGLGWALNAGGIITQIVRGKDDFCTNSRQHPENNYVNPAQVDSKIPATSTFSDIIEFGSGTDGRVICGDCGAPSAPSPVKLNIHCPTSADVQSGKISSRDFYSQQISCAAATISVPAVISGNTNSCLVNYNFLRCAGPETSIWGCGPSSTETRDCKGTDAFYTFCYNLYADYTPYTLASIYDATTRPAAGTLKKFYERYDQEPDLFYFSFLGNSGTFMYNQDGEPVMDNVNNIYIIDKSGTDFTITDSKGFQYRFSLMETNSITYVSDPLQDAYNVSDGPPYAHDVSKTWYLTSIISPNGDEVDFQYNYAGSFYKNSTTDLQNIDFINDRAFAYCADNALQHNAMPNIATNCGANNSYCTSYTTTLNQAVYLSGITFPNGSIDFVANFDRSDIPAINSSNGANPPKLPRLVEIDINDQNNNTIKQFNLTQAYGTSATDKRLLLSNINETGKPPYVFSYYDYDGSASNGITLPAKDSKGVDFWGYFNGITTNEILVPSFYYGTHGSDLCDPYFTGANRNANETYLKAGILTGINFPGGASTTFEYEDNRFPTGIAPYGTTDANQTAYIYSPTDFSGVTSQDATPVTKSVAVESNLKQTYAPGKQYYQANLLFSFSYVRSSFPSSCTDNDGNSITCDSKSGSGSGSVYCDTWVHAGTSYNCSTCCLKGDNAAYVRLSLVDIDANGNNLSTSTIVQSLNVGDITPTDNVYNSVRSITLLMGRTYILEARGGVYFTAVASLQYSPDFPDYPLGKIVAVSNKTICNTDPFTRGGGLRIKRIANSDGEGTNNTITRNYTYGLAENGNGKLIYPLIMHNTDNNPGPNPLFYGVCGFIQIFSNPSSNLASASPGPIVGYDQVTVYEGETPIPGAKGKTEYFFYNDPISVNSSEGFPTNFPSFDKHLNGSQVGKIEYAYIPNKTPDHFYTVSETYSVYNENLLYNNDHTDVDITSNTATASSLYLTQADPHYNSTNRVKVPIGIVVGKPRNTCEYFSCFQHDIFTYGFLPKNTQLKYTYTKLYDQYDYKNNIVPTIVPSRAFLTKYSYNADNLQVSTVTSFLPANNTLVLSDFITLNDNASEFADPFPDDDVSDSKDGWKEITIFKYPYDYTACTSASNLELLKLNNIIDLPLQTLHRTIYSLTPANSGVIDHITSANYITANSSGNLLKNYRYETPDPVAFSTFPLADPCSTSLPDYYIEKEDITYTSDNLPLTYKRVNDVPETYIWGYQPSTGLSNYLIAKAKNANPDHVAYSSFEPNSQGGWNYTFPNLTDANAKSGRYVFKGTVFKTLASPCQNDNGSACDFKVSFWAKGAGPMTFQGAAVNVNATGWQYYEYIVPGASTDITIITGNVTIDDLRLHPNGAFMESYTHDPLIGVTSITNERNNSTYYEYDNLQRLKLIRDLNGNILKKFDYTIKQ